jgi:hypothetical protein
MVEFEITTPDGGSQSHIRAYAGHDQLESMLVADLDRFKSQVYGGIYDMEFGKFGPEYANGAFQARLHFNPNGRGHPVITVQTESDWHPFSKTDVASRAALHLKTEPGLPDRFIEELRSVSKGAEDQARLEWV